MANYQQGEASHGGRLQSMDGKEKLLPSDYDPFRDIDCEAASDYEAITCTPEQTLEILKQLDHRNLS
jgi:hypothetical protein